MRSSISRRKLLRGVGVGLGLPWLEAMVPSFALAASTAPKSAVRLAVLYMPNGVNTEAWNPQGSGRDFTLSPTLQPLKDFKDDVVVVSNLFNAGSKVGDGHYAKEATILTCATIKKTPGADLANGVSMDQVAAQRVADQTPLPSLELGVSPVAIGVDLAVGYTRIYGSHIAWSTPTTPLARELNPRAVYERLFRASSGGLGNSAKKDTLLLDRVLGDARRVRAEVGVADRIRLDEYLSVMRSLEERVIRAGADDVTVHGLHHVCARRAGGKRQHLVERIQLELIVQRSNTRWRARRAITDDAAAARNLATAVGQLGASRYTGRDLRRGGRNVPAHPEHLFDDPLRRMIIRTVHHQREARGFLGNVDPLQRWGRGVPALGVAGELQRQARAVAEASACQPESRGLRSSCAGRLCRLLRVRGGRDRGEHEDKTEDSCDHGLLHA